MTLADFAKLYPAALSDVWFGDIEPLQAWWCRTCQCAFYAPELHVGCLECGYLPDRCSCPDGGHQFSWCPGCGSDGGSLYMWNGWPRLVLVGWCASPESGKEYPLPQDWLECWVEELGCAVSVGES